MSATPEQIAERLEARSAYWNRHGSHDPEYFGYFDANDAAMLNEAAALIRAQSEREKVLVELLQRLEPSIGWRSAMGMSRDFMCEFCHQTHEHFAHIEHTDKCPVPQVRAALAGAR